MKFLPTTESDPASASDKGDRVDGRNLINEWNAKMTAANLTHKYVWNINDFNAVKPNEYEHVLGLLSYDHMDFELARDKIIPPTQPSIIDMTKKAIELLQTNPNGFFLLVEGGKIDHGNERKPNHKFCIVL
jgi:alkaline phosphatase